MMINPSLFRGLLRRTLNVQFLVVCLAAGLLGCTSQNTSQAAESSCPGTASDTELKQCARDAFTAILPAIRQQLGVHWREEAPHFSTDLNVELLVTVSPDGKVLGRIPTRSSGNAEFDITAMAIIDAASPLPFPNDQRFHRYINTFYIELQP